MFLNSKEEFVFKNCVLLLESFFFSRVNIKNQFELHFEANRISLLHKAKLQETVLNPGSVSNRGSTYKHTITPRQECVLQNFAYI